MARPDGSFTVLVELLCHFRATEVEQAMLTPTGTVWMQDSFLDIESKIIRWRYAYLVAGVL